MTEKMTATDAVLVARLLSNWVQADPADPGAASVTRVVDHLHEQIGKLTSQMDRPRDPGIPGLTALDYFAAAALQGLLASVRPQTAWGEMGNEAYRYAEAALQARQRLGVQS